MSGALKILVVDDELNIRKTLSMCLEAEGHEVAAVSNEADALNEAAQRKLDLVFLDIRLGTANGLDLVPKLLAGSPWAKVVIITAYATIDSAVEAMRRGAFDYLPKPFATPQVYAVTRKVGMLRDLEQRVERLEETLRGSAEAELQSHSPAMHRALQLAKEVAPTDATVLVTGENGTGKGVLARAIHAWSKRREKPLGVVSCPSLSVELLESELFGHVKGAFTGAVRANPGRIAACEGGTLFLDEIGDLPLPLQPKLLRFLQDREYEAVGDTTTRRADVRVVVATNVRLAEAVAAGRLREDLFYRLNVVPIELPPLRDRPEDVVTLAERFLALFRGDRKITGFSDAAVARLQRHLWPGNVRELRNAVERATILCHGEWVEPRHLALSEALVPSERPGDMITLDALEEAHIRRVLAVTRSMEEAARILGIDVTTLWRRRKKYGL